MEYATDILNKLRDEDIRCELDSRDEKLGYKIRESQTRKIPYTLVIGDKEKESKLVTYRKFGSQETTTVKESEFIKLLHDEINNKGNK